MITIFKDKKDIPRDTEFQDASLHNPDGRMVMLLGLDVLPEHRKQGLGRELVYNYCRREEEKGRRRLVLTCLADKKQRYSFNDDKKMWNWSRRCRRSICGMKPGRNMLPLLINRG